MNFVSLHAICRVAPPGSASSPLDIQIFTISCGFLENLAKLIVDASRRVGTPLPPGNPGSASVWLYWKLKLNNDSVCEDPIDILRAPKTCA